MRILILMLIHNICFADVKFYSDSSTLELYSLKEACNKISPTHSLLADIHDLTKVDCTGTLINATDLCQLNTTGDSKGRTLLRGYTDKKTNELVCEKGTEARVQATASDKSKLPNCEKLQKYFARSLSLYKSSSPTPNEIHCYFETKSPKTELDFQDLNL